MNLISESSTNVAINKSETGNTYVEGVFSTAESTNINGRIYSKKILEREIDKLMESINNKCLWGECAHPASADINPERISHIIESLEWHGNDLIGKAKIIDTPMGNIAKTLIQEGKIGISSRGLGTVNENSYVNEDYYLITYDLVISPSNQTSWMNGIYEGKDFINPYAMCKKAPTLEEAKEFHYKAIWQVLENIKGNLI